MSVFKLKGLKMLKLIDRIIGIEGITYKEVFLGLVMFGLFYVMLFVLFALF